MEPSPSKQHWEHWWPFAGLPRMARAALMGLGSTDVPFVKGWSSPTRAAGPPISAHMRYLEDGSGDLGRLR
jgi:hypothetical protein